MRETKVICDKCKQVMYIDSMPPEDRPIRIELPYMGTSLDLCNKCYTDLRLTIGSWINNKED